MNLQGKDRSGMTLNDQRLAFIRQTVFFLLIFISGIIFARQGGFKYYRNYSVREYDHQAQNWGITQNSSGIIYVANQGGLLEYDGVSWRVYYQPPDNVYSLAIDPKGIIFVGGNNQIGYLEPDKTGNLKYQSLLEKIEKKPGQDIKQFGWVWSTTSTGSGIYFRTYKHIFHWNGERLKPISTKNFFLSSIVINGELLVQEEKRGLFRMNGETMEALPGCEILKNKKIYTITSYQSGGEPNTLLIGTHPGDFFLYNGKTLEPFPISKEVNDFLKSKKLTHGIRLSSGNFALASREGLIIMDLKGQFVEILDKSAGLQDDNISHVFQDTEGNLWLSLSKGISRIEYQSPLSTFDGRSGLPGLVISVVKHHNTLYAGTTKGLFYREPGYLFKPVPGIRRYCRSLISTGDSVIAGTGLGVFQVDKERAVQVSKKRTFSMLLSKHYPGHLWCGISHQLMLLTRRNGTWKETLFTGTENQAIYSIAETENGDLWLGTLNGKVFKVTFPIGTLQPVLASYDIPYELTRKEIFVAYAAGHIIFATSNGLFRFDEKKGIFIPDPTLGTDFTGGPEGKAVFRIIEDSLDNIWFNSKSRNFQAIPQRDGSYKIESQPFLRIPIIQVNNIYPDPGGKTIWFASNEGLIGFDKTVKKNFKHHFKAIIRKVVLNEKQENQRQIFYGYKKRIAKGGGETAHVLEYRDRNLLFEFAAPYFEAENETMYQYRLMGYDEKWSTWDRDTRKYYTNLDPGRYSFRVRAKNVFEHQGEEDVFKFDILPPWYLAWWAFVLYGAGFIAVIWLAVKWRSYRLVLRNLELEQMVKERTREIREKNIILKDQSQKLKEMDEIKSRFFANLSHAFRTPLTLIMSPLENMISQDRDTREKKELNMMLRQSQWLLTLINQLLDLARFDSKKEKLQAACENVVPFLGVTIEPFHVLAQQNNLDLSFHPEEEEIDLYFDSPKMEEVITNLLLNAIKFTPPGGKIKVSVSRELQAVKNDSEPQEYVNISVQDTGTGIARHQMEHIFDRFYHAGGLKENFHKGTGIGLAVANEMVKLHHGIIDVHSREGKGTTFVIRIPLGNEHLKPDEIVLRSDVSTVKRKPKEIEIHYKKTDEEDEEVKGNGNGRETKTGTGEGEQDKNVILVVEDIADVRRYIRGPLQEAGYQVVEAADGSEGLKKAKEVIPDLIVSDIMMPEKDGYQLCEALKKDINTSHIPVILLTAKSSRESVIEGLETGADDYVTKPFNTEMLLARIKNLIELRRQLQLKIQREKKLLPHEVSFSTMDEKFLNELHEIMEKNISDPEFNLTQMYKQLGISRSTLFRKMQAITGEKPNDYLQSFRLQRAARLLKQNFGNVTEVAYAVGFSTSQYFAKCFKEKFEQSPSSYLASQSTQT